MRIAIIIFFVTVLVVTVVIGAVVLGEKSVCDGACGATVADTLK